MSNPSKLCDTNKPELAAIGVFSLSTYSAGNWFSQTIVNDAHALQVGV
jgi:hypothetical protein